MERAGEESETAWAASGLSPWDGDDAESGVEREIRSALGVESAYGFHVEGRGRRRSAPDGGAADWLPAIAEDGTAAATESAPRYPCIEGHDYGGCLGLACPLERCWTGGATISYAHKRRAESHISTALYLPGAPCHTCAHLVEDELAVPSPRASGSSGDASTAGRRRGAQRTGAPRGESEARVQRIACGAGLWEHPISLSSFLLKRIPMLDPDEPAACPGYQPRPDPHPEVVAYLQRRRERARQRRADRRAAGDGR